MNAVIRPSRLQDGGSLGPAQVEPGLFLVEVVPHLECVLEDFALVGEHHLALVRPPHDIGNLAFDVVEVVILVDVNNPKVFPTPEPFDDVHRVFASGTSRPLLALVRALVVLVFALVLDRALVVLALAFARALALAPVGDLVLVRALVVLALALVLIEPLSSSLLLLPEPLPSPLKVEDIPTNRNTNDDEGRL